MKWVWTLISFAISNSSWAAQCIFIFNTQRVFRSFSFWIIFGKTVFDCIGLYLCLYYIHIEKKKSERYNIINITIATLITVGCCFSSLSYWIAAQYKRQWAFHSCLGSCFIYDEKCWLSTRCFVPHSADFSERCVCRSFICIQIEWFYHKIHTHLIWIE